MGATAQRPFVPPIPIGATPKRIARRSLPPIPTSAQPTRAPIPTPMGAAAIGNPQCATRCPSRHARSVQAPATRLLARAIVRMGARAVCSCGSGVRRGGGQDGARLRALWGNRVGERTNEQARACTQTRWSAWARVLVCPCGS